MVLVGTAEVEVAGRSTPTPEGERERVGAETGTEDEAPRLRTEPREDVRIERIDTAVLRNGDSGTEEWKVTLTVEFGLAPPLPRELRPPFNRLIVTGRRMLKERAGLALTNMRIPARPTMLRGLAAWRMGAVAPRQRICRVVADGWRKRAMTRRDLSASQWKVKSNELSQIAHGGQLAS